MKTYKCATGLIVMSDKKYQPGDYIDGAGTIVASEDRDDDIFSSLLADYWGDF